MKRAMVLGTLLLAGAFSVVGVVGQQSQKIIEVEQLEDNLFVLRGEGGGGNTAVFVTTTGVVVVDTKNPGWGQPILDQIRMLTSNPVTTLINTHSHGDHVSGNVAFPSTVEFVAHETTKANMEAMRPYTGRTEPPENVFEESNGRGLPTRTFTDRMTLGSGADQIRWICTTSAADTPAVMRGLSFPRCGRSTPATSFLASGCHFLTRRMAGAALISATRCRRRTTPFGTSTRLSPVTAPR